MLPDVEPFLHRVRALLPDTRGHGRSQRFERPEDYGYAAKAMDLLAWLDALGVTAAVFGGASMGAALSLWLAVHQAARVRGVFSISGPPYAPPEEDRRWWAAHRPLVAAGRFDEYFDANVRLRMGEEALARLKARPERYAELTEGLRRHSVASLLALLDETYSRPEWLADCARHPLPGADRGRRARPLSHRGDVPPPGRDHSRRAPARGGGWAALSQPQSPSRGARGDGRVPRPRSASDRRLRAAHPHARLRPHVAATGARRLPRGVMAPLRRLRGAGAPRPGPGPR